MKLQARLRTVRGAFAAANATQRWGERVGLRLTLTDPEGVFGQGEASPLPGYSPDTLAAARAALEALDGLDADPERPLEALPPLAASAGFAAEVALLDWAGRRTRRPLAALLPPPRHERLPVAALVRTLDEGRARLAEGYRTLKLKIGADLPRELALAGALREAGAGLRVDANGALDPEQLPALLRALADLGVELFEEPCAGRWPADAPVPLAVDESLAEDSEQALARLRGGEAHWAVLKPMCLGGVREVARLADAVREAGGRVLFSHTFGGPIERAAVAALALALGDGAPGLAPHAGLSVWPAASSDAFDDPCVRASAEPGLGLRWSEAW